MASRKRVLGLPRGFAPGAVACLVWGVGACRMGNDSPVYRTPYPSSDAGFGNSPLGGGFGGSIGIGFLPPGTGGSALGSSVGGAPCQQPQILEPVFLKQGFYSAAGARRELYSWTTAEQAAALRQDNVLFTLTESAGLGPGFAFTYLQQLAQDSSVPERAQLAGILSGDLFSKKRYAWSEPWATRMGWPGEDYGNQLLRIVLKAEAWVVLVKGGLLTVLDQDNQPVALADAIANPQRLGAIFYWKDAQVGGPECNSSFVNGSNGYREFILGNLAMVDEWSLGTALIRERLTANIDQLTRFLSRIRSCPSTVSPGQWNVNVACNWDLHTSPPFTEQFAYEQALAIPSENYLAVPDRIAALIETLQGDLFEPDPLVVTPGRP